MHVYKTIIIDEIFYNIKLLIQYSIKYSTGIANHYNSIHVQFIMLNTTTIDGCAVNQFNTTPGYECKLKNRLIDTNFYFMYYKQIKLNFKLLICKPSEYFNI